MSGLILAVGWPLRIHMNNLFHSWQSKLPPSTLNVITPSWDYHVHKVMKNFQIQWLPNYFIKIANILFLLQLRWETRWRDLRSNLSLNDSNYLFLQMNTWCVTNAPAVMFLWLPCQRPRSEQYIMRNVVVWMRCPATVSDIWVLGPQLVTVWKELGVVAWMKEVCYSGWTLRLQKAAPSNVFFPPPASELPATAPGTCCWLLPLHTLTSAMDSNTLQL